MKPVLQTTFAGKVAGESTGNCFAAALASILELSIEEVPNFAAMDSWWDQLSGWLAARGLGLVEIQFQGTPIRWAFTFTPGQWVLLSGKSPRGDWSHTVVGRMAGDADQYRFDYVHDPHPDATFLDGEPEWVVWLTLENPAGFGDRIVHDLRRVVRDQQAHIRNLEAELRPQLVREVAEVGVQEAIL